MIQIERVSEAERMSSSCVVWAGRFALAPHRSQMKGALRVKGSAEAFPVVTCLIALNLASVFLGVTRTQQLTMGGTTR